MLHTPNPKDIHLALDESFSLLASSRRRPPLDLRVLQHLALPDEVAAASTKLRLIASCKYQHIYGKA